MAPRRPPILPEPDGPDRQGLSAPSQALPQAAGRQRARPSAGDGERAFTQIQQLRAQGWSHRAIAPVVGVSYKTVERWLRQGNPPASGGAVVRHRAKAGQATGKHRLGPRQGAWLCVQAAEKLQQAQRQQRAQLLGERPELQPLYQLAQRFVRLGHQRDVKALRPWLQEAQLAAWPEVRQLARGLLRDHAAVQAALQLPYSNGPVEGQVTRLKLLKRQMYGRAKLALLRCRFLRRA